MDGWVYPFAYVVCRGIFPFNQQAVRMRRTRKRGLDTMKNRITKCVALIAVLCVLAMCFAATASAASYSKVYGKTQDKLRLRESASTNAAVIDNIVKGEKGSRIVERM